MATRTTREPSPGHQAPRTRILTPGPPPPFSSSRPSKHRKTRSTCAGFVIYSAFPTHSIPDTLTHLISTTAQMTAEEARHEVEAAVGAARSGAVLFVIHGVGTGKVRTSVLASLRKNPRVRKAEQQEGSNGTLVGWLVGFDTRLRSSSDAHSRSTLIQVDAPSCTSPRVN